MTYYISVFLVLLCLLVIWMALSMPVVEWSWSTGECVRVLPPEAGDCDQASGALRAGVGPMMECWDGASDDDT